MQITVFHIVEGLAEIEAWIFPVSKTTYSESTKIPWLKHSVE